MNNDLNLKVRSEISHIDVESSHGLADKIKGKMH
jgi:hypothetical protein